MLGHRVRGLGHAARTRYMQAKPAARARYMQAKPAACTPSLDATSLQAIHPHPTWKGVVSRSQC